VEQWAFSRGGSLAASDRVTNRTKYVLLNLLATLLIVAGLVFAGSVAGASPEWIVGGAIGLGGFGLTSSVSRPRRLPPH
jgi:hypothetical protein